MEEEFLNKLAALLKEYDATIWFSCGVGSDTFGLHEDRLTISIKDDIILDTENDWYLDSNNIINNM